MPRQPQSPGCCRDTGVAQGMKVCQFCLTWGQASCLLANTYAKFGRRRPTSALKGEEQQGLETWPGHVTRTRVLRHMPHQSIGACRLISPFGSEGKEREHTKVEGEQQEFRNLHMFMPWRAQVARPAPNMTYTHHGMHNHNLPCTHPRPAHTKTCTHPRPAHTKTCTH